MIAGVVLMILGALVFFIFQEIKILVEVSPFSVALITLFFIGLIVFGVGFAHSVADKFS